MKTAEAGAADEAVDQHHGEAADKATIEDGGLMCAETVEADGTAEAVDKSTDEAVDAVRNGSALRNVIVFERTGVE